jgi:peptidyl-prolyl cis-trans isomerase C
MRRPGSAGGTIVSGWALLALAGAMLVGAPIASAARSDSGKAAPRTTKTAGKTATRSRVLARLGATVVTEDDYQSRLADLPPQFKSQYSTPDQKREFINRLLEEKVWYEAALAAKVDSRPDVEKQLSGYRRDLLIRTYLGEVMQKAPPPADSVISAYYDAHQAEYMSEEQIKVRHIQLADERSAKDALDQLKHGADFAALAKKLSKDAATKDKGGDLGPVGHAGFFGSLGRQQAFADSAWHAPLHIVEGPLKTGLGWHVYEVTDKIPAKPRPLEEVKGVIVRQLTQQANEDFYKQSLAQEKHVLHLAVDSVAVNAVVNAKKSAVEMFRDAGDIPGADERMAAYRDVVDTYPASEYAPQALFMVGFVESEEKRDYDHAEGAFKELLQKYPSSELVSSAQWMLDNMRSDKTPNFDLPGDLGKASDHDAPRHEPSVGKQTPPAPGPAATTGTTGKP